MKTPVKKIALQLCICFVILLANCNLVFAQGNPVISLPPVFPVCGPCPWLLDATVSGGTAPYTYTWSNGTTMQDIMVCDTFPYTITVTDANGNTATATTHVQEFNTNDISFEAIAPTCPGLCDGQIIIHGLAYFSGQFAIEINGAPLLADTIINGVCSGTNYVAVGVQLCTASQFISFAPLSCNCDTTNQDCEKVCEGNISTYTAPLHAGSTYQWNVSGAQSYSPNNNFISVTWADDSINGGSGLIQYIEFLSNGETDSVTHCYKIGDAPHAAFTTAPAAVGGVVTICSGTNISFINQSADNTYNYWDFGNGSSSTASDPNYTYNQTGTFTVLYAATNECKCLAYDSVKVNVVHAPGPDIQCASVVCANDTVTYNTSMVCSNYNWSVTGGTIVSALPYTNAIVVAWGNGSAGAGTVTLNVGTCTGLCSTPTTISVPIVSPNATMSGETKVCRYGNIATYSVPNLPGTTFNWTVNGGNILSGQGSNSIHVEWTTTGTFTVNVSYSFDLLGCGGSGSLTVHVADVLVVNSSSKYCLGDGSASIGASLIGYSGNYLWKVTDPSGNLTTYTGPQPYNYTFTTIGNYSITAIPTAAGVACNDSASDAFQVISVPAPTAIVGDTIICTGKTYSYEAQGLSSGVDFIWSAIGGTLSSTTGDEISVTWNAVGPYALYVKQKRLQLPDCESDSISIIVSPYVLPGVTGSLHACPNGQSTYSINGVAQAGTYYEWSVAPALGSVINGQGTNQAVIEWFNASGIASVTVNAVNCNNQTATLSNISVAKPAPPVITPPLPSFCEGNSILLSSPTAVSYLWSDSTGAIIGQQQNLSVTNGGYYSLIIHDVFSCTSDTTIYVNEKPGPVASISTPDANAFCIPLPVNATVYALTAAGYSYQWYYNATPAPGSTNSPVYNVTQAGTYSVSVTNAQGCTMLSNTLVFYQDTCNSGGCLVFDDVDFSNTSCDPMQFSGTATAGVSSSVYWNFGDPNSASNGANGFNATHNFSGAGYYHVSFYGNAINSTPPPDSCTISKTHVVTVYANADFNVLKGCTGTAATFTDLSTYLPGYPITSWQWNFGDATATSPLQNPTHVFTNAGTYTVTLTIITSVCTATATQQITVNGLNASFTYLPTPVCIGTPIDFTDGTITQNQIINWLWEYGDGTASDNQNPNKSYTASGSNTVTLHVKDMEGCTSTYSDVVVVNSLPAQATITPPGPISMCSNATVVLTAPAGNTWLWTTNDTTQTLNVSHAGNYAVVVTTSNNCVYLTPEVDIDITPLPVADVSGPSQICKGKFEYLRGYYRPGQTLQWLDASTLSLISTALNLYLDTLSTGTHTFVLVASAPGNSCNDTSDVFTVDVIENPVIPVLTSLPLGVLCGGDPINLSVTNPQTDITYTWSEGSSSFYGGGTPPAITVVQSGNYTVTATNNLGCTSASTAIAINPPPDFSDVLSGCYEFCDTTNVTVNAPQGYSNYKWIEMTNGNWVFVSSNATLTLTHSGVYALVLTSFSGCTDTSRVLVVNQFHCCSLTAIVQGSLLNCFDENNGTATVTSPTGAGVSYLWSLGQTTASVSGLAQGDYYVRVSTAPSCQDIATVRIQSPSQMPVPLVFNSADSVYSNITDTTFNFQWLNNGTPISNANGLYYLNADSGCYQLQLTDYNGCVSISDTSCLFTGIAQTLSVPKSITLYPNPFSHSLTLVSTENDPLHFTLYDVTGRFVMQNTFVQKAIIETSGLKSAVYFYEITNKNKVVQRGKLVKE